MKIVSLNIRRLGSSHKRDGIKRLMEKVNPLMVLVEDTMYSTVVACFFPLRIKLTWKCCSLYAFSMSSCFLFPWDLILNPSLLLQNL